MSDSVRPHRRQAAHQAPQSLGFSRQEHWSGCHFLLQCMKVKRKSEVAQSCPTPSDAMDCSPPGCSVHGIFQARVLEWGAIAFSEKHSWLDTNWCNSFYSCTVGLSVSYGCPICLISGQPTLKNG